VPIDVPVSNKEREQNDKEVGTQLIGWNKGSIAAEQ